MTNRLTTCHASRYSASPRDHASRQSCGGYPLTLASNTLRKVDSIRHPNVVNTRILAAVLLLMGCERSVKEERPASVLGNKDSTEEAQIIEAQPISFILEYPSPPPADSGALFHESIKELSKRLTEEGIIFNTQGFLGNQIFAHGNDHAAKQILLDFSKTSPFKLHFLPQPDGEQGGAGQPATRSESK